MGKATASDNSDLQTRITSLRTSLRTVMGKHNLSQDNVADRMAMDRKTIGKFLSQDLETALNVSSATVDRIEQFVLSMQKDRGFVTKETYLAIADGMGADVYNSAFIRQYAGTYCVLRAHVPSQRPLISHLEIVGDADNEVIRYKHSHLVHDALSLLDEDERKSEPEEFRSSHQFTYEGFVFNCKNRAFLLSTARDTQHVKEMVLQLRHDNSGPPPAIKGLMLTISADDRQPFAARVLLQRMSTEKLNSEEWSLGLKPDWKKFSSRPEIIALFNPANNYGLLHLNP